MKLHLVSIQIMKEIFSVWLVLFWVKKKIPETKIDARETKGQFLLYINSHSALIFYLHILYKVIYASSTPKADIFTIICCDC